MSAITDTYGWTGEVPESSGYLEPAVLRLARELIFRCGILGEAAHQAAGLIGILQPVEIHMVVHRVVTDARACAMLF